MLGTIILARLLTPEDFGLVAMIMSIIGIIFIFKDLGLTDATIQKDQINHSQISTLFWINIFFCIFVLIFLLAIAPIIGYFFKEPKLKLLTIALSTSFFFIGLSTQHLALLKRNLMFRQIMYIEILSTLFSISLAIVFAILGFKYWALVIRLISLSIFTALFAWFFCKWRPGKFALKSDIKSMLIFGTNINIYFLINYFARNLDKTLIGWRFGAANLGLYQKAHSLFGLPVNQLTLSLQGVAVTTFSKIKDDPHKFRRYYFRALSVLSFVGMPLCALMVVMSKDIIYLLLGPQWEKATNIFSILGLASLVQIIDSTKGWIHVSIGRPDRWLKWGIFSSISIVVSIIIGLPFGPLGVATTFTIITYILTMPAICYAGKPVGITFSMVISIIWKYFISASIPGILIWYIFYYRTVFENLIPRLTLTFVFYLSGYLLFIYLFFNGLEPLFNFISYIKHINFFPKHFLSRIISRPYSESA